jgi:hypothetical protein
MTLYSFYHAVSGDNKKSDRNYTFELTIHRGRVYFELEVVESGW